jgi:hypothetical protein
VRLTTAELETTQVTPTRVKWTWLAVLAVFAGLLIVLYIRAFPEFSPVDEFQHFDYMIKASRGEVVRTGDHVGLEAMHEEACRGLPGASFPSCNSTQLKPADFQEEGFNTAYIHPPVYYFITGIVAKGFRALLGINSLLTAGRLVGILWLGGALYLMWLICNELAIPLGPRLVSFGLMITSPATLDAMTKVNPDAASYLAGASILYATLLWERKKIAGWVVALIGVIIVLIKVTNLLGVGLVFAYILIRSLADPKEEKPHRRDRRNAVILGVAVSAVSLAAVLAWVVIQARRATMNLQQIPMNERFHIDSLSPGKAISQLSQLVTPIQFTYIPPFMQKNTVLTLIHLVNWLVLGTCIGLATLSRRRSRWEAIAVGALAIMFLGGPLLTMTNYLFARVFFVIPPRYGLSLIPALFILFAASLQKKPILIVVGFFTLAAGAYILTVLFGA